MQEIWYFILSSHLIVLLKILLSCLFAVRIKFSPERQKTFPYRNKYPNGTMQSREHWVLYHYHHLKMTLEKSQWFIYWERRKYYNGDITEILIRRNCQVMILSSLLLDREISFIQYLCVLSIIPGIILPWIMSKNFKLLVTLNN